MRKLLLFPFVFLYRLLTYPITVYKVMKARRIYNENKVRAWNLFYSANKKWLTTWYKDKGLNSKPPVFYDQHKQKWIMLNRRQRRNLKKN